MRYKISVLIAVFAFFVTAKNGYSINVESQGLVLESYVLEDHGKNFEAVEKMSRVYSGDPNDYFVNLRLGWLFSTVKKYKNSTEHYIRAAKILPDSVEPLLGLTRTYLLVKDFSNLVRTSTELLKHDPRNYLGLQRIVEGFIGLQRNTDAESELVKALQIYPTDPGFLEKYGFVLSQIGKAEEARKTFSLLLLISPKNETARVFLTGQKQ